MKYMPRSAIKWYKMWINQFPESWHLSDLERFYMFVSILLKNSKRKRTRFWLEENLKQDCKKLSSCDIGKYCDIYEHIRDYEQVWKSQQAKLIAQEELKGRIKAARERYRK